MDHWYVIKSKPKKEKEVLEQLGRARYDLFFPSMRGPVSPKPLFPSYLFVRTDLENPYHHRMIRFTRGVSKILGDGEGPLPVADMIVEILRQQTKDGSLIEQELLYKEGDEVRVKRGILKDLAGIIEKNLPAAGRVKILFKWLNTSMRAVLRYTDLEKVA
jgi:transcription antitermination factor NusG